MSLKFGRFGSFAATTARGEAGPFYWWADANEYAFKKWNHPVKGHPMMPDHDWQPVEVEDEGARPPNPLESPQNVAEWRAKLLLWSLDDICSRCGDPADDRSIEYQRAMRAELDAFEAAIREEATAALRASTVNMSGEAYADILTRADARAEAAEGAWPVVEAAWDYHRRTDRDDLFEVLIEALASLPDVLIERLAARALSGEAGGNEDGA